jgi:hypothetical protein
VHQHDARVIPELYRSAALHRSNAKQIQDVEGQNCIFEKNLLRFKIYPKKNVQLILLNILVPDAKFPDLPM